MFLTGTPAMPRTETRPGLLGFTSSRHTSNRHEFFHLPHESGSVSGGQSQPNPSCSRLNPPDHSAHHFDLPQIRSDLIRTI
ncbi:hypothetical protein BO85DRAFT_49543 [Aspergillus piperis CBS 112811]|uniref:Uncharacterized protein n=1 Tax=Aspergillus piperis CBS 112811 TaxID=1448313 RepID=A0A8G1VKD1_9EURO|nr:hypothetical protein BO85DRAFT_49543 [Aspergillus piperis CBS 112811]RAH56421.1 hypothetical protein BO85DRAFT_49543 [Aspergillus piperis CBS 112811]